MYNNCAADRSGRSSRSWVVPALSDAGLCTNCVVPLDHVTASLTDGHKSLIVPGLCDSGAPMSVIRRERCGYRSRLTN